MRTALVIALLCLARPARAADELLDNLLGELTTGVSNTNAVAGHGRLTAGISRDGDVTVLSWPGPTTANQIGYFSTNDANARDLPHFGSLEGMGARIGLVVTTAGGTSLTFLRDAPWSAAQTYSQLDAPVPVTTFTNSALGLTVTLTDVVLPDADVLSRQLRVQRAAGSPVIALQLAAYENLSPTLSRVPMIPIADWALPARADFAAVWDADSQALLHFHPGDRGLTKTLTDVVAGAADPDFGPAGALMKTAAPSADDVAAMVAALDQNYPAGVAALVSTEPAPAQFQAGSDATPFCALVGHLVDNVLALPTQYPGVKLPIDPSAAQLLRCTDPLPDLRTRQGWQWAPRDALADLEAAPGALSGSPLAAGQTNGALLAPLQFAGDTAEGAVLFAFGSTRAQARAALDHARSLSRAERQSAAEAAPHALLAGAALPDPALGERVRQVALRALVNVYVARDATTSAIVASISRQPPYELDWPRDGAFIDTALELAGRSDWVDARLRWYTGLYRAHPAQPDGLLVTTAPLDPDSGEHDYPAGALEMNYYADGAVGGPIRFEIDNTALHEWSIADHAGRLSAAARGEFLGKAWPSSQAALDLLARWTDKTTLLPAPANEDDHGDFTSTLHGAAAAYAGLAAGERLAQAAGDDSSAARYRIRARELRRAIVATYFDPATGLLRAEQGGESGAIGGPAGWFVWPGRVFDSADDRLQPLLAAEMARVLGYLRGDGPGAGYLGKVIVAAALYGRGAVRSQAREAIQREADMAEAGTLHFGEIFQTLTAADGSKTFVQRVATPHVWEGVLFYLGAMALTSPEKFNGDQSLPPSGCGCHNTSSTGPFLALLLLLHRRQKGSRHSTFHLRMQSACRTRG